MTRKTTLLTGDKITLMLSLIPYLLENGATPIAKLAHHFNVDAPTVRSIIRFFGTAGIPGDTATYQHEDLFDIDWDALDERDEAVLIRTVVVDEHPRFSPREVAALLAGLQYLTQVPELGERAEIDALMQKLTLSATQASARVDVSSANAPESLREIRQAIEQKLSLQFGYRDSSGRLSSRLVIPQIVESVDDVWYVRAWCTTREASRLFRMDRMVELSLGPDAVTLAGADALEQESGNSALYTPSESAVEVQFSVPKDRVNRLRAFDVIAAGDQMRVSLADEGRAFRLAAVEPGAIEVLAPASARSAVADWADRALAQYDA